MCQNFPSRDTSTVYVVIVAPTLPQLFLALAVDPLGGALVHLAVAGIGMLTPSSE
jgi:hypothetical protein